jgi:hypothetical protein
LDRHDGLTKMLALLAHDVTPVRVKALYCISGTIQNAPTFLAKFESLNGMQAFMDVLALRDTAVDVVNLQKRVLFLVRALAMQYDDLAERLVKQYAFHKSVQALLDTSVDNADVCEHGANILTALLPFTSPEERVPLQELIERVNHLF